MSYKDAIPLMTEELVSTNKNINYIVCKELPIPRLNTIKKNIFTKRSISFTAT